MDLTKQLEAVFSEVIELPITVQDIVVEDIIETAKSRVQSMREICERRKRNG